jgi:hypothetical protein
MGTDKMMKRIGDRNDFAVLSGSSLCGDDKHSGIYQVSHAVQMCLVAGVDHLHTAKSYLLDFHRLPAASLFSLVRGSLENLAAAYWMLHPHRRDDRIERTLRWHAKNFKDQKTALEPHGIVDAAMLETRLAKLDAIATPRGISTTKVRAGYTSTQAIEYAEQNSSRCTPLLAWRLCSGYAHGRPWAYLSNANQQAQFETTDPEVVKLNLTSDPSRVLYPAKQGYLLMLDLVELLQTRSKSPTG